MHIEAGAWTEHGNKNINISYASKFITFFAEAENKDHLSPVETGAGTELSKLKVVQLHE